MQQRQDSTTERYVMELTDNSQCAAITGWGVYEAESRMKPHITTLFVNFQTAWPTVKPL